MKKVLVLEDESSIRSFIVINLRRAGYEVIEAGTGEEALEMLQQHSDIRVALLDVMLPGIDGFEVCRRIRGHQLPHRHHHAHRPLTGDGQGHGPDDRSRRLRH